MRQTSLSIEACEFLSAIGASSSDFEKGEIDAIHIHMLPSDNVCEDFPFSLSIHGTIKIIVLKSNFRISSLICVTDVSNLQSMVSEQTLYNAEEKKLSYEVKGVFLSHLDANRVLMELFENPNPPHKKCIRLEI